MKVETHGVLGTDLIQKELFISLNSSFLFLTLNMYGLKDSMTGKKGAVYLRPFNAVNHEARRSLNIFPLSYRYLTIRRR